MAAEKLLVRRLRPQARPAGSRPKGGSWRTGKKPPARHSPVMNTGSKKSGGAGTPVRPLSAVLSAGPLVRLYFQHRPEAAPRLGTDFPKAGQASREAAPPPLRRHGNQFCEIVRTYQGLCPRHPHQGESFPLDPAGVGFILAVFCRNSIPICGVQGIRPPPGGFQGQSPWRVWAAPNNKIDFPGTAETKIDNSRGKRL